MTEVIAFLNGADIRNSENIHTLVIKYLGSMGLIISGMFSGIDGPMAKIGAGLAIIAVRKVKDWRWFRKVFYGQRLDIHGVETHMKANEAIAAAQRRKMGTQSREGSVDLDSEEGLSESVKRTARNLGDSLLKFLEQKKLRLFATLGAAIAIAAIFRSPTVSALMFGIEKKKKKSNRVADLLLFSLVLSF
jgi:H+/Cl- antiporter ClcA